MKRSRNGNLPVYTTAIDTACKNNGLLSINTDRIGQTPKFTMRTINESNLNKQTGLAELSSRKFGGSIDRQKNAVQL
jgi:hypothetical protein